MTLAQIAATRDPAWNLALLDEAVLEAVRERADLLVLPEYASAFDPRGPERALAQSIDGPFAQALAAQAAQQRLAIIAGLTLEDPVPPGASNAVQGFDDAGNLVLDYRKVHLYDAFEGRESQRLVPGSVDGTAPVVDIARINVGVLTCYDLRFPESARRLVDAGAQVLVVPAAWAAGSGKADQWRTLLRARAIENVAVVVGVGMAGPGVVGGSLAVGPDGRVLAELEGGPGFLTVDVEPEDVAARRRADPSLANRRFRVVPR